MEAKLPDIAGITIGLGHPNFSLTSGANNTFVIGTTFSFAVNGKTAAISAATGITTPTTDANTAAAFPGITTAQKPAGTVLLFGADTSGTYYMAQGSVETLDAAGNFINPPKFPTLPDKVCPIAYVVVKASSSLAANFVPGTSNWNQTGITTTAVSLCALPDRPQVA